MRRYIQSLHKKPEHTRKQIAFGVSSAIMVLILGVWVTTFSVRFGSLSLHDETIKKSNQAAVNSNDSLDDLRAKLGSDYQDLQQQLNNEGVVIKDDTSVQQPDETVSGYGGYDPSSNQVIISDPE